MTTRYALLCYQGMWNHDTNLAASGFKGHHNLHHYSLVIHISSMAIAIIELKRGVAIKAVDRTSENAYPVLELP